MLAADDQRLRHTSTATGKTLIAVASANMLPAIHGRSCWSNQKPNSIIASNKRLGCPRSNMSKTNEIVTKPGSANNQGPGVRPKPDMACENCAVIHHAAALTADKQM